MIKNIKLLIETDSDETIEVELERWRVDAVIKLLGLEIESGETIMNRRKWKRENKVLISDKQLSLFL